MMWLAADFATIFDGMTYPAQRNTHTATRALALANAAHSAWLDRAQSRVTHEAAIMIAQHAAQRQRRLSGDWS